MKEENCKNEGKYVLEKAIKDLEDKFVRTKKKEHYRIIIQFVEKSLIETILERTFGNQCKAAKLLGINRNTLCAKIKKYNINVRKIKEC